MMGTGYYDYREPLPAVIPGLADFQGKVVHPQFWSHDLDYVDKKVVVIGSGATAITLIPNLAEKAARVTMLQRSPSYVISIKSKDPLDRKLRQYFPTWVVHKIMRAKYLVVGWLSYNFCKAYPERAKRTIAKSTRALLPPNVKEDPHFQPRYNPWDQRMCVCPDGDFYNALHGGKCEVETGTIKTVTPSGISLDSGRDLDADIIVTATGLNMQFAGCTQFFVDGEQVRPPDKFLWKGVMLQDLPNVSFLTGYPNASYTLGSDAAAQLTCRLMKRMRSTRSTSAVPRMDPSDDVQESGVMSLTSTYVTRARHRLPKDGDRGPWQMRKSYFSDMWNVMFGDLTAGMQLCRVST